MTFFVILKLRIFMNGDGLGESVLILFAWKPCSGMEQYKSDSSKLEVSTTAGDGAENLEFGKGEGWTREGAEDTEPRERTIAEETLLHSLDALFFATFTSIFVRVLFSSQVCQ